MDGVPSPSWIPLHRCKTLHLVRHAQAIHNVPVPGEKDYYVSQELFDAQLTPLGWKQVDNLKIHVKETGLVKKIELVIVSPLLRTMQTAVGVFGGEDNVSAKDGTPVFIVENARNSSRRAISSLDSPPFVAVELCRERMANPSAQRRSVTEYRSLFPSIDFSLIENDEDIWWKADMPEAKEEVAARGMKFINWLWTRKEKEIAIVTHGDFLSRTLTAFPNDLQQEIYKGFTNCELRSVVIVDRGLVGSDASTTNYPGNIPHWRDWRPSEIAQDASREST